MWKLRTIRYIAVAGAVVSAALLGIPGQAQALDPCLHNNICFYWGGNLSGAVRGYYIDNPDFGGDTFSGPGAGYGERVKNNSASVYNDFHLPALVCYNENYGGPCDYINPHSWRNLNYAWNDNASFRWIY
ncbi:peptidase inhibitor family I36 protein [Actinomadura sp. NPDC048955]|uniref:peptidase inhibitor family I36 protein n=1 Tax=Actinomadura sp. NPDC048955 TaxID=3158228 RepID=UPI0033D68F02